MKKIILFSLLLLSVCSFGQYKKDTIILENGKIILPDRILRIDSDSTIWYSMGFDNIKSVKKNNIRYYSNNNGFISYTPPKSLVITKVDEIKDVKIRLQNFHDEMRWSQTCYTISLIISIVNVVNVYNDPLNTNNGYVIGSTVFGLGGLVLNLHSYTHLDF